MSVLEKVFTFITKDEKGRPQDKYESRFGGNGIVVENVFSGERREFKINGDCSVSFEDRDELFANAACEAIKEARNQLADDGIIKYNDLRTFISYVTGE